MYILCLLKHKSHEPGLNEVKYLPLPNTTRQQVKQRYNDGVGLDKIIDGEITDSNFYSSFLKIEIRGPIVNQQLRSGFTESATWATFITRQDIRNIVRKIEDSLKHRHQIDAVSVDHLVKELKLEENRWTKVANLNIYYYYCYISIFGSFLSSFPSKCAFPECC